MVTALPTLTTTRVVKVASATAVSQMSVDRASVPMIASMDISVTADNANATALTT